MPDPTESTAKAKTASTETPGNDGTASLPDDQELKEKIRRSRLTAAATALGLKPGEEFREGMSASSRYDAPAGASHSASGGLSISVTEDLRKNQKLVVEFSYQEKPDGTIKTDSWQIDAKSGRITSSIQDKTTGTSGHRESERTGDQISVTDRIRVTTFLEGSAYRPQWYRRRED